MNDCLWKIWTDYVKSVHNIDLFDQHPCFKRCIPLFLLFSYEFVVLHSLFYFHVKKKILPGFEICISVPLKKNIVADVFL